MRNDRHRAGWNRSITGNLRRLACAIASVAALGHASTARSQTPAVSFHGKTINLVVGFGAGDGFDTHARLLARYLSRHLPGEPSIVVQNMPGAGSLTALNSVLLKGARDGTTLGLVNPVSTVQPLLQPSIATFDPREISWIGSMASDYYTCGFWTDRPITLANLRGRKVVVGSTALSGGTYAGDRILGAVLGLDLKIVAGYRTMNDLVHAAEKGEVEGHCGVMAVTLKSVFWDDYRAGRLQIPVAATMEADPDLAQIPNAFDIVTTPEDRQLLTLLAGPWYYGRPILAPAGLAPEIAGALRTGFDETMEDDEFRGEAERLRVRVNHLSGQKVLETVRRIYEIPPATIERARPMFGVQDH